MCAWLRVLWRVPTGISVLLVGATAVSVVPWILQINSTRLLVAGFHYTSGFKAALGFPEGQGLKVPQPQRPSPGIETHTNPPRARQRRQMAASYFCGFTHVLCHPRGGEMGQALAQGLVGAEQQRF